MDEKKRIIKNELKVFIKGTFSMLMKLGISLCIILPFIYRIESKIDETGILKLLGGVICISILWNFIISIIKIIASLSALRSVKNEQLTHYDLKKYEDYYREILEINSPLVVDYIDEFEINKSTLVAELLYLRKNNIIDINDNEIKINHNSNLNDILRLRKIYIG